MKKLTIAVVVFLACAFAMTTAYGVLIAKHNHSGGTDKYGCHYNHKTGGYHCHNPKLSQ